MVAGFNRLNYNATIAPLTNFKIAGVFSTRQKNIGASATLPTTVYYND